MEEQLSKFAAKLSEDIENKTFDEEKVHIINKTRDILDFSKVILMFRKQKFSIILLTVYFLNSIMLLKHCISIHYTSSVRRYSPINSENIFLFW